MRYLVAILCPPIAVLSVGRPAQAAVNVALTLCLIVPGVMHALMIVDRYYTERRNSALMEAITQYYV